MRTHSSTGARHRFSRPWVQRWWALLLCTSSLWALEARATAYAGPDLKGENLSIACPWTGEEGENFRRVTALFERRTGAVVRHDCSPNSAQEILANAQNGKSTHISFVPQPGLVGQLAAMGAAQPLGAQTKSWVERAYAAGTSWSALGDFQNAQGVTGFYGFAFNVNVKSLVWYIPKRFREKGYAVPRSMEQMETLIRRMVAEGHTPWCIGLESEGASGWPATDWVEDLMLRLHPPQVYDDWVSHRIPFNDARVVEAIEAYGTHALHNAHVAGGPKAVVAISFKESPRGLFGHQPSCFMHRQGSFVSSFFPEHQAKDADFFYFPSHNKKMLGYPVLGGGTMVTITKDSKAARAFVEFLKHPESHETWMAMGGFLTPHRGVDRRKYKERLQRKAGDILLGATTFRFDASDLMPAAVGAGSFWKGMLDYTSGKPAQAVANDIEATWNALK